MPSTVVLAVIGLLILVAVYRVRGLAYALAALVALGILYAAYVVLVTASMG